MKLFKFDSEIKCNSSFFDMVEGDSPQVVPFDGRPPIMRQFKRSTYPVFIYRKKEGLKEKEFQFCIADNDLSELFQNTLSDVDRLYSENIKLKRDVEEIERKRELAQIDSMKTNYALVSIEDKNLFQLIIWYFKRDKK